MIFYFFNIIDIKRSISTVCSVLIFAIHFLMYRNGGKNIMDYYEINADTLCILPIDEKTSFIYEKEDNFIGNMSCIEIIKRSCLFFGSSYEGRKNASSSLLNATYKLPIIIEESNQLIFFPTNSSKNSKCVWISYNNFEGVDKISKNFSKIYSI